LAVSSSATELTACRGSIGDHAWIADAALTGVLRSGLTLAKCQKITFDIVIAGDANGKIGASENR
jgi:hypothetical protein